MLGVDGLLSWVSGLLLWRLHTADRSLTWRRRRAGGLSAWLDAKRLPLTKVTTLVRLGFFARDDVDEEVEHVGFGEGAGDVAALKRAPFVFFRVDPGAHGEFGDEDVAAFGEEDGSFGRDHLHLRVGFHDLFDPRQWKLVQFVIMILGFKFCYLLLPIGIEDIAVLALEALGDLSRL